MKNPPTMPRSHATAAVSTANHVGETFGDFRILKKLGQGGMGEVYLAEQISLKRKVAIKMLLDNVAANANALARFQEESTTIAKLSHANVVQAYMVGEHDGRHYLVMEYVEGISLGEYMEKQGALEVPLVLSLLRQVASALQKAGELGIIHRDIKPANILITRKAEAKVADFGLSRCLREERVDLTRQGSAVGTPLYMSPEQIQGEDLDCRSDIYSLGVTCYQMLSGQVPFGGSNAYVIAAKHMREKPVDLETIRPDLPTAVCDIVRKMMAKKPDDRFATARELLKELSRVRQSLNGETASVAVTVDDMPVEKMRPEKTPTKVVVPIWKRPMVWVGVAGGLAVLGILVVIIVGGGLAWFLRKGPVVEPEPRVVQNPPEKPKPIEVAPDPADALKLKVDQILKENTPNPGGVDVCIDLAMIYLGQQKTGEAETLFRRMTERKPPSTYYFVGRLGLAVTDAMNDNDKASRAKFTELFDSKMKDNRVQILNDYLTKNPDFAAWVNEADSHHIRTGVARPPVSKGGPRWPPSKFPIFKK